MRTSFFANGEYRPLVPIDEEEEYGNNQGLAPTGLRTAITRQWKMLLIGACIFSASIGYIGRAFLSDNGGSVLTSPMQFAAVHTIVQDDVSVDSSAWCFPDLYKVKVYGLAEGNFGTSAMSVDMASALNMPKSLVMGSWVHDSTSGDDRLGIVLTWVDSGDVVKLLTVARDDGVYFYVEAGGICDVQFMDDVQLESGIGCTDSFVLSCPDFYSGSHSVPGSTTLQELWVGSQIDGDFTGNTACWGVRSEDNNTIGEITYLHYYSDDEDVGSMSFFFHDAYEAQPYSDEVAIGDACLGVVPATISKTGKPLTKETISISSLLQRAQQLKYRDVQQISNPPS